MSCCQLTFFDIMICHVIAFFPPPQFFGKFNIGIYFSIIYKKKFVLTLIFYYQNYNLSL